MTCPKCGSETEQVSADPDVGLEAATLCLNENCDYVGDPIHEDY